MFSIPSIKISCSFIEFKANSTTSRHICSSEPEYFCLIFPRMSVLISYIEKPANSLDKIFEVENNISLVTLSEIAIFLFITTPVLVTIIRSTVSGSMDTSSICFTAVKSGLGVKTIPASLETEESIFVIDMNILSRWTSLRMKSSRI